MGLVQSLLGQGCRVVALGCGAPVHFAKNFRRPGTSNIVLSVVDVLQTEVCLQHIMCICMHVCRCVCIFKQIRVYTYIFTLVLYLYNIFCIYIHIRAGMSPGRSGNKSKEAETIRTLAGLSDLAPAAAGSVPGQGIDWRRCQCYTQTVVASSGRGHRAAQSRCQLLGTVTGQISS